MGVAKEPENQFKKQKKTQFFSEYEDRKRGKQSLKHCIK